LQSTNRTFVASYLTDSTVLVLPANQRRQPLSGAGGIFGIALWNLPEVADIYKKLMEYASDATINDLDFYRLNKVPDTKKYEQPTNAP
jgi:hypothetical protein